jgi:hypothetical protein
MLSVANKPVMLSVANKSDMLNVVMPNVVASGPILRKLGTFLVAECHFLYVFKFRWGDLHFIFGTPVYFLYLEVVYQSTELVPKNLASEIIPSLTFAAIPFWELGWPVK